MGGRWLADVRPFRRLPFETRAKIVGRSDGSTTETGVQP
jgi:hypothetical protein